MAERDAEIKSLREQLAKKGRIWLPGLAGPGRGGMHDDTTQKRSIGCVALSSDEALTRFDKYVDL